MVVWAVTPAIHEGNNKLMSMRSAEAAGMEATRYAQGGCNCRCLRSMATLAGTARYRRCISSALSRCIRHLPMGRSRPRRGLALATRTHHLQQAWQRHVKCHTRGQAREPTDRQTSLITINLAYMHCCGPEMEHLMSSFLAGFTSGLWTHGTVPTKHPSRTLHPPPDSGSPLPIVEQNFWRKKTPATCVQPRIIWTAGR